MKNVREILRTTLIPRLGRGGPLAVGRVGKNLCQTFGQTYVSEYPPRRFPTSLKLRGASAKATGGKQKKEMRHETGILRTVLTQNVQRFVSLRENTINEKPTAFVFGFSWQSRLLDAFGGTTNYFVTNMNNKVVGKPTHNHLDCHTILLTNRRLVASQNCSQ